MKKLIIISVSLLVAAFVAGLVVDAMAQTRTIRVIRRPSVGSTAVEQIGSVSAFSGSDMNCRVTIGSSSYTARSIPGNNCAKLRRARMGGYDIKYRVSGEAIVSVQNVQDLPPPDPGTPSAGSQGEVLPARSGKRKRVRMVAARRERVIFLFVVAISPSRT